MFWFNNNNGRPVLPERAGSGGTATQDPPPLTAGTPMDLNEAINDALSRGGAAAGRIHTQNERRGAMAEGLLRGGVQEANQRTITDETVQRILSGKRDAAGMELLDRMKGLREYGGAAGITGGGHLAGIATNFERARHEANLGARREVLVEQAKTDAVDRINHFNRQQVLAQTMMREFDTSLYQFESDRAGILLGAKGIEAQERAALAQADATRDAGRRAERGNIIGGILGAVGGIFGGI